MKKKPEPVSAFKKLIAGAAKTRRAIRRREPVVPMALQMAPRGKRLWSVSIRGDRSNPEHLDHFHIIAKSATAACIKAAKVASLRNVVYVQISWVSDLRGGI